MSEGKTVESPFDETMQMGSPDAPRNPQNDEFQIMEIPPELRASATPPDQSAMQKIHELRQDLKPAAISTEPKYDSDPNNHARFMEAPSDEQLQRGSVEDDSSIVTRIKKLFRK